MARPKPRPTPLKPLRRFGHWLWNQVCLSSLKGLSRYLGRWGHSLASQPRFTTVLVVTLLLIGFSLLGIWPTTQPFEGNLTVSELSFTNTQPDKLFLKDLQGIPQLTLTGQQSFTLVGTFASPTEPRLNQRTQLRIELPQADSQWILAAPKAPSSELELLTLHLQQHSRVRSLQYKGFNRILAFSLTPHPAQPTEAPSLLSLNPGTVPLKITLERYRLPDLQKEDFDNPLEFTFQSTQLDLPLPNPIDLYITLSDANGQEFRGDIDVQDVKFETIAQTGQNFNDTIANSTIQSGTIRMAEQSLTLEENQFLLIDPPGIQNLRRLKILKPDANQPPKLQIANQTVSVADPPQGFSVDVSGLTDRIRTGLNPQLPVSRIQSSFLSRFLTKDQLTALISFSSALVLSLLAWLVDNIAKNPEKSQSPPAPPP